MKNTLFRKIGLGLILPAVVVLLWIRAVHSGNISSGVLPGIEKVGETFLSLVQQGQLQDD